MATKGSKKVGAAAPSNQVTIDNIGERTIRRALELLNNPELYQAEMNKEEGNPISLGPRVTDPASWAADQIAAAKAKATKWLEKSRRPKKVPSVAALAANEKRIERLNQSLADKTWEGAMGKVDEDLRMQVIEKGGAAAFSSGIDRHSPKVDAKVKVLQPLVLALAQELDRMSVATDSEREAKMIAAKRGMQQIGKTLKGV